MKSHCLILIWIVYDVLHLFGPVIGDNSRRSTSKPGSKSSHSTWTSNDDSGSHSSSWSSSGETSGSSSGSSVTTSCVNGRCTTCVNGRCFHRAFAQILTNSGCPVAACDNGCSGFVTLSDGCPICRCEGYYTREPCHSNSDCDSGGICHNSLCKYSGDPSNTCSKCENNEMCSSGRCVPVIG